MSKKIVEQKPAEKKPDQKAVQDAIDLLATLDEDQASTVLANIKGPALTAALRAQKEQDDKKQAEQDKAIQDNMAEIGKILNKCQIDRTVVFHRTDKGAWEPKFPKNKTGSGGKGKTAAKAGLTEEMKTTIDKTIDEKTIPEKSEVDKDTGTAGKFIFQNGSGKIEIPTSWVCFHLLQSGVGTATDVIKLIGHWGVTGGQARSAENRIRGR